MEALVATSRIYFPPEDETKPEERVVLHPETSAEAVVMDEEGRTLDEVLGPQIVVSSEKPEQRPCFWCKVTATRNVENGVVIGRDPIPDGE